jgi:hypothetical protein
MLSGRSSGAKEPTNTGGLAQLARALDLHSRGHRFDSDILHRAAEAAEDRR